MLLKLLTWAMNSSLVPASLRIAATKYVMAKSLGPKGEW